MKRIPSSPYDSIYVDQRFERAAVFEVVRRNYDCVTALYPGCSVHITPSFFFPHVVYVDSSDTARRFFEDRDAVLSLIERGRQYKRSAFLDFIAQDYTTDLPLHEQSFDLLISLYAGGVTQACKRYLKIGGLVLTNNHHDDAGQAARDPSLALIAVIHEKGEQCKLDERDLSRYFVPKGQPAPRRVQTASPYPEYTRTASYYLFRRLA